MIRNAIDFAAECGMPVLTDDLVKLAQFYGRVHAIGMARGVESASLLWGFFMHQSTRDPSQPALMGVYRTKAGAWRAMWRYQWDAWEQLREPRQRLFKAGYLKVWEPTRPKKLFLTRSLFIKPIEVQT